MTPNTLSPPSLIGPLGLVISYTQDGKVLINGRPPQRIEHLPNDEPWYRISSKFYQSRKPKPTSSMRKRKRSLYASYIPITIGASVRSNTDKSVFMDDAMIIYSTSWPNP